MKIIKCKTKLKRESVISQLQSIRDYQAGYIDKDDKLCIFRRDVEALDYAIDVLKKIDNKANEAVFLPWPNWLAEMEEE